MTIDEAIECEINHRLYPEYHGQLAEWLEKLKTVENIMLIYNANWYADEDNGVPDCEVLESIWNVIQGNGLDIDIEQDYRKGKADGYNKAIDDFEEKLLYQIGDLGVRDIIMETAEQLRKECGVRMSEIEAIEELEHSIVSYEVQNKNNITCDLTREVLDMAINALEKQEKIKGIIANANQWSKEDVIVKAQAFCEIEAIMKE